MKVRAPSVEMGGLIYPHPEARAPPCLARGVTRRRRHEEASPGSKGSKTPGDVSRQNPTRPDLTDPSTLLVRPGTDPSMWSRWAVRVSRTHSDRGVRVSRPPVPGSREWSLHHGPTVEMGPCFTDPSTVGKGTVLHGRTHSGGPCCHGPTPPWAQA